MRRTSLGGPDNALHIPDGNCMRLDPTQVRFQSQIVNLCDVDVYIFRDVE